MNNPRDFWTRALATLQAGETCVLLCVVDSVGSSPGRTGFKMCVTSGGALFGSIGGGSMEHKLVELARSLFDQPHSFPFLKRQIHQPGIGQDRSGMICSGEQTVGFFYLDAALADLCKDLLDTITSGTARDLLLTSNGISLASDVPPDPVEWSYREPLLVQPRVAIIGGGHISLALSRTMNQLGFHVHVFDDRDGLNTMRDNAFAHERSFVDYHRITEHLAEDPDLFIALVSFGYRTDEIVLRQMIRRRYKYLGLLGSAEKVRTMFVAMRQDGFTDAELAR
ncbi:MAG: XdhC family protein, partial [Flavobacteriales bacterium]